MTKGKDIKIKDWGEIFREIEKETPSRPKPKAKPRSDKGKKK